MADHEPISRAGEPAVGNQSNAVAEAATLDGGGDRSISRCRGRTVFAAETRCPG